MFCEKVVRGRLQELLSELINNLSCNVIKFLKVVVAIIIVVLIISIIPLALAPGRI